MHSLHDFKNLCYFIPVPPSAPVGLQIARIDKDSVTLEWRKPKDDGGAKPTGYVVMKREPDSDEGIKVATLKPSDLIYKIKDLPNRNLYFAVAAENPAGVGPAAETDKPVKPKYPAGMLEIFLFSFFLSFFFLN